jgi:hypothetical protein
VRIFRLMWFMYALFIAELLSLEEVEPCRD